MKPISKSKQKLIDDIALMMVKHYFDCLENGTLPELTTAQKKKYEILEKRYKLFEHTK